jgi:hypothetical protein
VWSFYLITESVGHKAYWISGTNVFVPAAAVGTHDNKAFNPEDGGSMILQNVDILPQHYTPTQPSRPPLESSSP